MATDTGTAPKDWVVLDNSGSGSNRDSWGPMTQHEAQTMEREGAERGRHYIALPWAHADEGRIWHAQQAQAAQTKCSTP